MPRTTTYSLDHTSTGWRYISYLPNGTVWNATTLTLPADAPASHVRAAVAVVFPTDSSLLDVGFE